MNHEMKLNSAPYAAIESGMKTIELRLNDEKRQKIKVGDTIMFSEKTIPEKKLYTRVKALHHAESFEKLFDAISISVCGFDSAMTAKEVGLAMREYYSETDEKKYGVLGIEIEIM